MSEQTRRAYFQELLDQSWLYRLRTAIRHGIPVVPGRNVIEGARTETPDGVGKPATDQPARPSRLALAAALALGGIGAAAGIYSVMRPNQTTIVNQGGDVLEWLDEEGLAPK